MSLDNWIFNIRVIFFHQADKVDAQLHTLLVKVEPQVHALDTITVSVVNTEVPWSLTKWFEPSSKIL